MVNLNSDKEAFSPNPNDCNSNESDPAENFAAQWFNSICEAAKTAAKKTLPKKSKTTCIQRKISKNTRELYEEKKRLQQKKDVHKRVFKKMHKKIKTACLNDYKSWIEATTVEMEKANAAGDVKAIYRLVKSITGKPKKLPTNLTTDKNGNLLQSPQAIAETWRSFLSNKFQATEAEDARPPLEKLPKTTDPITRKEFDQAVKKLNLGKATGPDGIPAVVYKSCPLIKDELFKLLQFMWEEEVVPTSFVTANFKMLFKGKGSHNDPSKYRCIALLNHAYKALSLILLGRLISVSEAFLQEWQAGFRAFRGCRDNSMALRVLCEKMMALGKSLTAVFIDYRAAFDSVSHKYVDTALKRAGASAKARAMYRAIYKAAAAYTEATHGS